MLNSEHRTRINDLRSKIPMNKNLKSAFVNRRSLIGVRYSYQAVLVERPKGTYHLGG